MKPLSIQIIYNDKTKEKAFEIYNAIKKHYKLYHEYQSTITTPMFEVNIGESKNRIVKKIPDILLLPDGFEYIPSYNNPYGTKVIWYSKDEEIELWEQY